jgi:iron complex transport system substrate-binding protein
VADAVALDLRRRIAETRARTEHLPRPRLLYVLNSEPLITVGPDSFLHQLIELAGGHNIAGHARTPYPRLSLEEVVKEDPQVIIFPVGTAEGIPGNEQERWRRWTTMSAVRNGRFHRVPSDLLNRPGPRIAEGLKLLAKAIHPTAFAGEGSP